MSEKLSRRTMVKGLGAVGIATLLDNNAAVHAFSEGDSPPAPAATPAPLFDPRVRTDSLPIDAKGWAEREGRLAELVEEGRQYILNEKYANESGKVKLAADITRIRRDYLPVLKRVLTEKNITLEPDVQKAFLGLMLIESEANHEAAGGGLCQMSPLALEKVAQKTPALAGANMQTPFNNIWAAATLLEMETKETDNEKLYAIWRFHLGQPRLDNNMQRHLDEQLEFANTMTVVKLIDSPSMQQALAKVYTDKDAFKGALYYVPRALAAGEMVLSSA